MVVVVVVQDVTSHLLDKQCSMQRDRIETLDTCDRGSTVIMLVFHTLVGLPAKKRRSSLSNQTHIYASYRHRVNSELVVRGTLVLEPESRPPPR